MEVWKDIEGFNGDYAVSSCGKIESRKNGKKRILSPSIDRDGYLLVGLWKGNVRYTKKVHRLVAEAYIPNPRNHPQINHKDENPANNNVENLEWCTAKYNINYGNHTEKVIKSITGRHLSEEHKSRIRSGATNSKAVIMKDKQGNEVARFVSASEAARCIMGKSTNISRNARGEIKSYKGYVFSYVV